MRLSWIATGIVLVIIIAVAVLVVVLLTGDKKRANALYSPAPPTDAGIENQWDHVEKTEFFSDAATSTAQFTIQLSRLNNPSKTWTLPVSRELFIGRAPHCSVQLDDTSVSREQCKILVQGFTLVVVHLSSTNKTTLNGINVVDSPVLQSGDTLKFGRESLRIDYIQMSGSTFQKPEPPKNNNHEYTASLF